MADYTLMKNSKINYNLQHILNSHAVSVTYNTAFYIRLSNEDESSDESNKIENQKAILFEYLKDNIEFNLVAEYIDNGRTGRNYKRPEWNRLLADIKLGRVNCVIVKDLSRLGRNYQETGKIMEETFPIARVRLVAVRDHYDSNLSNDNINLEYPIKNISNEFYSIDLSSKISSAREMQRLRGEFTGSIVPYGFKRDPNKKGHFLIDEKQSKTVELIFNLFNKIGSYSAVARKLNCSCIPSPKKTSWNYATVKKILQNRAYIGELVQGQKSLETEIVVMQNSHEAIISMEIFETAQKGMVKNQDKVKRIQKPENNVDYLFNGYVFTKQSDIPLTKVHYYKNGGKTLVKAYRTNRKLQGNGNAYSLIQVREEILIECFIETINKYIKVLDAMEKYIGQTAVKAYHNRQIELMNNHIKLLEKKLICSKQILASAYQDMVDGTVQLKNYRNYRDRFLAEQEVLEKEIQLKSNEKLKLEQTIALKNPYLLHLKKMKKNYHITKELITLLVDKVKVISSKDIEITFKFSDEFANLENLCKNAKGEEAI